MSDSLSSYTVNVSTAGPNGPWTVTGTPPPSALSFNDITPVNPQVWYKLAQTTSNGVVVPYIFMTVSTLPVGQVTAVPDPNDFTMLIFTWTVPDKLPAPIGSFELSGKFQDAPEESRIVLEFLGGDARTVTTYAIPTDDLSNPFTYLLEGIIPR